MGNPESSGVNGSKPQIGRDSPPATRCSACIAIFGISGREFCLPMRELIGESGQGLTVIPADQKIRGLAPQLGENLERS